MPDLEEIYSALEQFRAERDWAQYHNPKDLAIAINVESSELLELFLWKDHKNVNDDKLKEELADILSFAFLMAIEKKIDIKSIILNKINKNALKYPIDKSKGNAKKYNEF